MLCFNSIVAIVGVLLAVAHAVNITFVNLDGNNRTIHFTPAAGQPKIKDYHLSPNGNVTVKMPFQVSTSLIVSPPRVEFENYALIFALALVE
jgi:hypothetical protein